MSDFINVAVVGVGNCASALIQGIKYYTIRQNKGGLIKEYIGKYGIDSIQIKTAYDIDERKVGKELHKAIYSKPNCTKVFNNIIDKSNVIVKMGNILDSIGSNMVNENERNSYLISKERESSMEDVINEFKKKKIDVVVNYLPVGSLIATEFYAMASLKAKAAFVNCIPVFMASSEKWSKKFKAEGVPLIGDDIKSQIGATILHRALTELCERQGVIITKSYQISTGGNTDFKNMLNRDRIECKRISKEESIKSTLSYNRNNALIHAGPADYIWWKKDSKVCYIELEGMNYGMCDIRINVMLNVEDSPNSAAVVVDLIRCAAIAKNAGLGGSIIEPSAVYCKRPPKQILDSKAVEKLDEWINRYA